MIQDKFPKLVLIQSLPSGLVAFPGLTKPGSLAIYSLFKKEMTESCFTQFHWRKGNADNIVQVLNSGCRFRFYNNNCYKISVPFTAMTFLRHTQISE